MKRVLCAVALIVLPAYAHAGDVSGTVYTMDGSFIAGATVRAGGQSVRTGEDGAFSFEDLPEGVVELEIEAERYAPANPLALTGDVVTVTLVEPIAFQRTDARLPVVQSPIEADAGIGTITGTVTVDGKPLANAPVIVQSVGEHVLKTASAVSNAKGVYTVRGLPPLHYTVTIDDRLSPRLRAPVPVASADDQEPSLVDLRKARAATRNLELQSAPLVRGTVTGAGGKPVRAARIQLVVAGQSALDVAFDTSAVRTAADGTFVVPVPEWPEDSETVIAVTPLLSSTVRSKPFVPGDRDLRVNVTIPALQLVKVRVVDREHQPVAGARVAFASAEDARTFDNLDLLVETGFTQRLPRTNAEGEVTLQMHADAYEFAVGADGFQTTTLPARAIAQPHTVDVTLDRAVTLTGRVHRNGRGVANVGVSITEGSASKDRRVRPGLATATSTDGRFQITGLAPGTYRVTFFKQLELIDGTVEARAPGDVQIPLPPAGTLRARVLDAATGQAVPDFVYAVEPVENNSSSRGPGGIHDGGSAPDGVFTVEVPEGTYRVTAGAAGFLAADPAEVRVVANETSSLDLPLGRGVTVTGRVADETGLPVADAEILATLSDREEMRASRAPARAGPAHVQTAEDGTFTLTGVPAGEVQFGVSRQGYVPFRKTFEASGMMSIDVTLSRGLSIEGIVTRAGKPVAGARVGASTAAVGAAHQSATSGEDGRFVLRGLIPARYTVSAFLDDVHAEIPDVDPARRKEVVLSLDPKPRGVVFGTVTGLSPAPAAKGTRNSVMVQGPDRGAEGTIDEAGNYRIEDAPVGRVVVGAYVESAARVARSSARKEVEVVPGQPLRVDLDLGGNVRVSGRVTNEGRPVAATVGFSSLEGISASASTREDGEFELSLPAAGRYHVFARSDETNEKHFQTVRDIKGGETLDIDLREQVLEGTVLDASTRRPVAGALVTLSFAEAGTMPVVAEIPTDAGGRFRIATRSAGSHRLIASAPGYAHQALKVGTTGTPYSFELSPAEPLRVRVLDVRTGTPLEAYLLVTETDGMPIPGRFARSGDGTASLFFLSPGRYRLTAIVHGYTSRTIEVTAPGEVEVALE